MIITEVVETPINIAHWIDEIQDPAHGASSSFVGTVRNRNLGKDVLGVSYDVAEPLAQNVFKDIAQAEHIDSMNIVIVHFKGRLDIGGVSILIAVSSPHRREAISACNNIIEAIKHRAPIWKQEHYVDGDSEWVQGHALCQHH